MQALRKIELKDLPRGPMRIDDYGNPVQNIYIRKVEKVGGELQNTVVHTYDNVSQFWNYRPEEYLKQPPIQETIPLPARRHNDGCSARNSWRELKRENELYYKPSATAAHQTTEGGAGERKVVWERIVIFRKRVLREI